MLLARLACGHLRLTGADAAVHRGRGCGGRGRRAGSKLTLLLETHRGRGHLLLLAQQEARHEAVRYRRATCKLLLSVLLVHQHRRRPEAIAATGARLH